MRTLRMVILALTLLFAGAGRAQPPEQTTLAVTIPDLTGLTPPQAVAALNAARLQLGSQSSATASAPALAGTIAGQIPAAGSTISAGTAVDIVVAYAPNIRLIYDNNDLTIINTGDQALDLRTIDLQASDAVPVRFDAARWGRTVDPTDCVQVWAIRRRQAKSLAECRRVESWLSTTDASQHVWKESAGVQRFVVRQNGVVRGECPAAGTGTRENPLVCQIYLEQPQAAPVWPFIYFAYTPDTLIIHNTSGDSWMRLNAAVQPATGGAFTFNEVSRYRAVDGLVVSAGSNGGSVLRQLAPSQCVRFRTATAPTDTLPEPCLLFADALVDGAPFWGAPFTIQDSSGDKHVCEAAVPDTVTICRVLR